MSGGHDGWTRLRDLRGSDEQLCVATALESPAWRAWAPGRKRKKRRRKRKTPKTSSSRAARTRKSGHSSTSSSVLAVWNDHSGGVMGSVACGSSILLGMLWLPQHSANSVLQLVLWGEGRYIYTDMVENTRGAAVHAGWFCWLRCTSCDCAMCVFLAWRQAQALRHHGLYGTEGQFLRA